MTREIPAYSAVGDFEISIKVNEILGSAGGANLLNVTSDAMDTKIHGAIRREIQKYTGDAAVNVEIRYEAPGVDLILNGLTWGLYALATAHVSGVVIKYNKETIHKGKQTLSLRVLFYRQNMDFRS